MILLRFYKIRFMKRKIGMFWGDINEKMLPLMLGYSESRDSNYVTDYEKILNKN